MFGFWEYNLGVHEWARVSVTGVCVWECESACLSPLVSYSNWLSKDLKLLDGTRTLRNVESFLLLPQSGTRPGRIRQWCFKDQRKNCHKGCGTWIWPRFLWAFLVSLSKQKWSRKSPKRGVKIHRFVEVGAELLSRNIEENPFSFRPDWNRSTSSFLPVCSSASCLMVYCIISVSSFLFLGLRNPHAVQFICLSVHKQQFKAGPGPSPF